MSFYLFFSISAFPLFLLFPFPCNNHEIAFFLLMIACRVQLEASIINSESDFYLSISPNTDDLLRDSPRIRVFPVVQAPMYLEWQKGSFDEISMKIGEQGRFDVLNATAYAILYCIFSVFLE